MKTAKEQILEWLYGKEDDYFTLVIWNETIQSTALAIIACLITANIFARTCNFFARRGAAKEPIIRKQTTKLPAKPKPTNQQRNDEKLRKKKTEKERLKESLDAMERLRPKPR